MVSIMQTGLWMPVLPSNINGTELGALECIDFLFLRYGIDPPKISDYCGGCGMAFDIFQALDCNKGGPIMACHNKICDGVTNLARKTFTPTHVCEDPKIYKSCAMCGGKGKLKGSPLKDEGELKVDLFIEDLWI